ncbi:MAG TPA: ferrochelatase [Candidatus Eisenbacteria bacterium]
MKPRRHHVVLVTYGEPARAEFFTQLRYSWRILLGLTRSVASIPAVLLPIIALSRARMRVALWRREDYESPLEPITEAQARGLGTALARKAPDVEWQVHVAYEFRDPLLVDLLGRLPRDEAVDVIPMYVAESAFTHEISRRTVEAWRLRGGRGRPAPVRVLPGLDEETFADVAAGHVLGEIRRRGIGGDDWAMVIAAHGTLLEPPRPINTGRGATECVAAGVAERCSGRFGRIQLGWLNHVYGGEWTKPPADAALRMVAEAGYRKVVYFPFGFSADNAESQLEGRVALRTQPRLEAVHLPCVNDSPEFLDALADSVIRAGDPLARPHEGGNGRGTTGLPAGNDRVEVQRLSQLSPGERSIILRLEGEPASVRRLMELGLVPGTEVVLIRRAPLGDPLELRMRDIHLSLRREEAAYVHVSGG